MLYYWVIPPHMMLSSFFPEVFLDIIFYKCSKSYPTWLFLYPQTVQEKQDEKSSRSAVWSILLEWQICIQSLNIDKTGEVMSSSETNSDEEKCWTVCHANFTNWSPEHWAYWQKSKFLIYDLCVQPSVSHHISKCSITDNWTSCSICTAGVFRLSSSDQLYRH